MARVLIVEDQKKLLQSLARGLKEEGYDVITAANGEEGYYLATTAAPDAIVLDLMLPGRDGLIDLRDLRSQGSTTRNFSSPGADGCREPHRGAPLSVINRLIRQRPEIPAHVRR